MGTAKKFLFDVSFDPVAPLPEAAPPIVVEETFTRAELEAACAAAHAEGRRAALSEANEATAARIAAALEALAREIPPLIAAADARAADVERQGIAALRAVIAKTVPALAARESLAEIEALATRYLVEAIDEPRIVLRVANEIYEAVRERLDAIAAASGYGGRIVLLADDRLSASDARIEWADGGVERNLAAQLRAIDDAIARLSEPAGAPAAAQPSPRGENDE
jgi:flagellar assembly protein FliH